MSAPLVPLDDERCPVCGVLMYLRGMPFAQDHIFGPVLDTETGQEYTGHPVTEEQAGTRSL